MHFAQFYKQIVSMTTVEFSGHGQTVRVQIANIIENQLCIVLRQDRYQMAIGAIKWKYESDEGSQFSALVQSLSGLMG